MEEQKKLIILDSNSLIHRSFHALPPLTTRKGELINAVYGFCLVFLKILRELQPDYVVATFDFPGPTIRHKEFKEYKAKRPKAPAELYSQIPKVKEILKAFNVNFLEKQGFEADDLIATICQKTQKQQIFPEIQIYILTGDSDACQLINKNIKIYTLGRRIKEEIIYDENKIKEKFGLLPSQMNDFKALAGDPSDNIPGATGIGKKTAIELLKNFESLENLYKKIEKGETEKLRPRILDILIKNKEQVFLSRQLVQARFDVPIDFEIDNYKFANFDSQTVKKIFEDFGFRSLIARIPNEKKN